MEFKKKTIIWEDNSEPPKDYIWIKPDGKAYEFDYTDRIWKESKSISAGTGSGSGSNVELLTLNVTENGEYTPDEGKAYNKVNVDVSGLSLETLMQKFNNFEMYIKPETTGFFSTLGEPITWGHQVKTEYTKNRPTCEPGESLPLEDYVYISDMDVFKLLVAYIANSVAIGNWNEPSKQISGVYTSHLMNNDYGDYVNWEFVTTDDGDINLLFSQPVGGSSWGPEVYLWIDPNDYTKFIVPEVV